MKRILVTSGCGGVGRTTVAANLAYALSTRGERVRLVDSDPQQALDVHFRSLSSPGNSRSPGFTAGYDARPLAPNIDLANCQDIDEPGHRAIIDRRVRHEAAYEIIDLAAGDAAHTVKLRSSDLMLCVMLPEARCFRTVPNFLNRFEAASARQGGSSKATLLGMVNGFEPESQLARDTLRLIEETFGDRLLKGTIMRDAAVAEAFAAGLPVAEYASWSQAAHAFGTVAESLLDFETASHVAA